MFQLSFASYCPPAAFCEQSMIANPPTGLNDAEDWNLLAIAEVGTVTLFFSLSEPLSQNLLKAAASCERKRSWRKYVASC